MEVAKELGVKYNPDDTKTVELIEGEIEGWPERPHEKPSHAAKGHKQYYGHFSGKEVITGLKQ